MGEVWFAPDDPSLPPPWKGVIDGTTGHFYFWNPETNITQYEKPAYWVPSPSLYPSCSLEPVYPSLFTSSDYTFHSHYPNLYPKQQGPPTTVINGYTFPLQFPFPHQTHTASNEPIHTHTPSLAVPTSSECAFFHPQYDMTPSIPTFQSPSVPTFVPQPQFSDPKPPSSFHLMSDCENNLGFHATLDFAATGAAHYTPTQAPDGSSLPPTIAFDSDSDSDNKETNAPNLKTNEEYACRYEHNKNREDLHRYEDLKRRVLVDDHLGSDSSSEDDDVDVVLAANSKKNDLEFFATTIKVKVLDPILKNTEVGLSKSVDTKVTEASNDTEDTSLVKAEDCKTMKELLFKRHNELEEIYSKVHMDVDRDGAKQILNSLIGSGNVRLSDQLASMDAQIVKAKQQTLSRKDILDKVEKSIFAFEEEIEAGAADYAMVMHSKGNASYHESDSSYKSHSPTSDEIKTSKGSEFALDGLWDDSGGLTSMKINFRSFFKLELWDSCDVIALNSSALQMWLVGYPDTIRVFMKTQIQFLGSHKKVQGVKKSATEALGVDVVTHKKTKSVDGTALMVAILGAMYAQSKAYGHDTVVVGRMAREDPKGNLLQWWFEKLKSATVQLGDVTNGLFALLAVKEVYHGTAIMFGVALVGRLYGKKTANEVSGPLVMCSNHGDAYIIAEQNPTKWTFTESPQIFVPIANGTEEMEAIMVTDILQRVKAIVVAASVEDKLETIASRKVRLEAYVLLNEVAKLLNDLIVLPDGLGVAQAFARLEALLNHVLEAPRLHAWFKDAIEFGNPCALLLALKMGETVYVDSARFRKLLPGPFIPSKLFSAAHMSSLAHNLMETTFCQPHFHIVWSVLFNILLPDSVLQATAALTNSNSLRKHKKNRRSSSFDDDIAKNFQCVCEVIIEDHSSSHDRKHLAFNVLLLLLLWLPASYISTCLSYKVVQCIIATIAFAVILVSVLFLTAVYVRYKLYDCRCTEIDLKPTKNGRNGSLFQKDIGKIHHVASIMVARDVASREFDITHVAPVINFDFSKSIDDYVHRIGHTDMVVEFAQQSLYDGGDQCQRIIHLRTKSNSHVVTHLGALLHNCASKSYICLLKHRMEFPCMPHNEIAIFSIGIIKAFPGFKEGAILLLLELIMIWIKYTVGDRLLGIVANIGTSCSCNQIFEAVLEHLLLASRAMVANGQEVEVTSVDSKIGDTYLPLSGYEEAVFAYEKALNVFKTTKGENHPSVGSVFIRLAYLYNRTGGVMESISYCENALRIYEKPMPGVPPEELVSGLTDIAAVYESMNEREPTVKLFQNALKIYNDAPGQQIPQFSSLRTSLFSRGEDLLGSSPDPRSIICY